MSDRVYVVKANEGCYEDRAQWIVGVFTDLEEARTVAERERDEVIGMYTGVDTEIETWTVGKGSERQTKGVWLARWEESRFENGIAKTSIVKARHMDGVDASDRPADWDKDYPRWVVRGGNTKAEAELRLAEAMSVRVSA